MSANNVPEIKVPSIGTVTSNISDIVRAVKAEKEILEVREGIRGPAPHYDAFVRYRDLILYLRTDQETVASLSSNVRLFDLDDSHYLKPTWNEDDTSDRTLNLKVHGADRTIDLYENLAVANGYDVTLQAEDAATTVLMDNVNFEVENLNATQRSIKVTSSKAGNTVLTLQENLTLADGYDVTLQALGQANALVLNESLTVGNGYAGTITFSAESKVFTVDETASVSEYGKVEISDSEPVSPIAKMIWVDTS